MNKHHRLNVDLTLLGPILTRGSQAPEPGIDAPAARDARGRVMLPYSLIKGKVRDALIELYGDRDSRIVRWLGKHPHWWRKKADDNTPPPDDLETERGLLRFGDFHTTQPEQQNDKVIQRIEIDQESGSAKGRMLAMLEAPYGYGEEVTFSGAVDFVANDTEAAEIAKILEEAFRWTPAFGAMRSVGFGRTHKVTVSPRARDRSSVGSPSANDVLPIRLTLDRPLCIVGRKHSRNHFESLENISGAVLKGALARLVLEVTGAPGPFIDDRIGQFAELCRNFEAIRFTEARPLNAVDADRPTGLWSDPADRETRSPQSLRRPVEPPLSIVTIPPDKRWLDVALESGPRAVGGKAPTFRPDWKENVEEGIRKDFGFGSVPRERRTRTAIEETTGRSKDQMLFSYGFIQQERKLKNGTFESLVWESMIDLSEVLEADRGKVRDQLADLLSHGLPNIGKSRATAAIEWLKEVTPAAMSEVPRTDGLHVVTLQTEFLMTDPEKLKRQDPEALRECYKDFWSKASDGAFELVRYFARQSLSGGFQAKKARPGHYEPFLLTDRGSVFVLQARDPAKASVVLDRWRRSGLPGPSKEQSDDAGLKGEPVAGNPGKWIANRYGQLGKPLWMSCPFLPHVGYGEVAIDLACHTQNTASGE